MKPVANPHLRRTTRVLWVGWLVAVMAVLVVARVLTPSDAGYGTHLQLGLPPCGILLITGLPCPSCGLTTSFAHMVRLQWIDAWHANPWGVALFVTMLASVPLAIHSAKRGKPLLETLHRYHAQKIAFGLILLGIGAWIGRVYRVWIG
jgi:hypothetical protein